MGWVVARRWHHRAVEIKSTKTDIQKQATRGGLTSCQSRVWLPHESTPCLRVIVGCFASSRQEESVILASNLRSSGCKTGKSAPYARIWNEVLFGMRCKPLVEETRLTLVN